jgi:hypothetical protein
METMTVEITNQKAISFLHGLEELHLIRVVKRYVGPVRKKLSDKYRGIMTREQGQELKRHINEMRNEWDSI